MEYFQQTLQIMFNFWPLLFLTGVEGVWKGRIQARDPRLNAFRFLLISWLVFAAIRIDLLVIRLPVRPVLPEWMFWWAGPLLGALFLAERLRSRAAARRRALLEARLQELRSLSHTALLERLASHYRAQGWQLEPAAANQPCDLVGVAADGSHICIALRLSAEVGKAALSHLVRFSAQSGASRAIIAATGVFRLEAQEYAREQPLELIDGETLAMMLL